jgi:hypothetical protein
MGRSRTKSLPGALAVSLKVSGHIWGAVWALLKARPGGGAAAAAPLHHFFVCGVNRMGTRWAIQAHSSMLWEGWMVLCW